MRARCAGASAFLLLALACGGGGGGAASDSGASAAPDPPFDVAGEIQIAFASAVDRDVNDTQASTAPNDTPATAQPLANPVTLGGYANVAGRGAPGRSFIAGDPFDYYRVALAAGQSVRIFMSGNGTTDDLDLALLNEAGVEVAFSDTNTPTETVVAPASGEYVIEVTAFAGASSYVLAIGQGVATASAPAPEFVPGEVIVRFRDDGAAGGTGSRAAGGTRSRSARAPSERASELGLERFGGGSSGPQLLGSRDTARLDSALRSAGAGHLSDRARHPAQWSAQDRAAWSQMRRETRRLAKALRGRDDVLSADLNYLRQPSAVPADEFYPLQWHYPLVHLPEAWDAVSASSGVVIAVIDTGIVDEHTDLQGQLVAGYDFIQDPLRARDGNGCDADPSDPGDATTPGASSFHGTHVTGTLVARTSLAAGGGDEGVAGIAWNAHAMPLRALGVDGGTDFDLIQALLYAARLPNACGVLPAAPADVINLSLGGPDASATLDATLAQVRAEGIVIVAAAGNQGSSLPTYPAASPGVLSVVAVDAAANLAPYSNFGASVDLAAPGGDLSADRGFDGYGDGVLSTLYDDAKNEYVYGFYQGTSMAAPHVAGVIALMLGVNPALTPTDIDTLLANGSLTRDIGSSFLFGRGLIDAFDAVSAAIQTQGGAPPSPPARLVADPGALNFGAQGTLATVTLANAGGNVPPLQVTSVEALEDDGGGWLGVLPGSVAANGLGSYSVTVARTGLADGIYTGVVRYHSNAGDLDVSVIVQVGQAVTADANAGHHYVVLVDPDSGDTVDFVQVEAQNGRYSYSFLDVEPGEYLIYAGTDADNDHIICDRGEACGSYPTLDQPRALDLQDDAEDLDFLTGFGLRLGASSTSASQGGISRDPIRAPVVSTAR
jgi:serine protease